ncbi:M50 family metallopeptidase [Taklimakanibacter deserti]|uniref:M50 family metallopeptidase n=1 Tax=Taklimakanibacter deserti TaxID=2267839 RepID=UPI0013C4FF6E
MSSATFLSSSWYRVANLRPKLREHISVSRHRYRGRSWYVLNDRATGSVHRLSSASYLLVGNMDGRRTIDQIWREAATSLGQETPSQDEIIYLLGQLNSADLLQTEVTPDSAGLLERAAKTRRSLWLRNVLNPLAFRKTLWYPDPFFERTLPLVKWLFSWPAAIIWLAVVIIGIILAALNWQALSHNATDRILAADNILLMALCYPVLKALHELGHGYALKAFGGAVHEIGVIFLVFFPMPYVDASDASKFRSKWQRALVGAAGMIVEVFLAAVAMCVWTLVEPGVTQAVAFNVMLIAGISTLLFNGNPLLRFDGYYILADLLEIPNLSQRATRYWRYLVDHYVFRTDGARDFAATAGERVWLFLYAPASFVYRQFILLAIAIFVAEEYLAVGIAIAMWSLLTCLVLPIGKALWQVAASPRYRRNRARVVTATSAMILASLAGLFLVPAPLYTTAEGIVWLPESAQVRAGTNAFVSRLLVEPGRHVSLGEALMESEEPMLDAKLELLQERIAELAARLAAERFADRVQASITTTELTHARAELANTIDQVERLTVRSRSEGTFFAVTPQDLPGRFLKEGELIGYVLPPASRIVRAAIGQDDIALIRGQLRHTSVRLAARPEETLSARIVREVPTARDELPSKALGGAGGGALPVDPRDEQGTKTLRRVFQVDIELVSDTLPSAAFGSRVYVRFDHPWEPVGQQLWRRTRQLLLSRLQV